MTADRPIIQTIEKAFFFGHYDSRGGASLVVAKKLEEACRKYEEMFFAGWEEDDPGRVECDPAGDDFEEGLTVLVFDEPVDFDGEELLEDYGGKFKTARIWSRYPTPMFKSGWSKWRETQTVILYRGKRPTFKADCLPDGKPFWFYEARTWEPGEDAFGLILM